MKIFLTIVLCLGLSVEAVADEQEISRLLLSEVMYYRMQDNNFDAITHYLNANENNALSLSKNNNAYIASVYLNYDLHSQVGSMLDYLITNESAAVRDMSWFYLGKLHYRNKRVKSAVKAFSKIEGKLADTEQEMKHIMYGVMAMNDKKYDVASKEFIKVSSTSVLYPYVEYNLALARVKKDNDLASFSKTLNELATKYANKTEESYVFADRIYTTLGFVLLQNKQYEQARQVFRKVTLDGHLVTRALQGMIYATAQLQQYEQALNLSLQLIKMTIGNESVHHAYIVIPYLLQKLNDSEKATAFYQHAVEYFDSQRISIKKHIDKTKKGEFDNYLLDLEKILNVDDWVGDKEMGRLFRFVSTLDEWRDAVYKYREMQYLEKRLEESFYQLVVIESDVQAENQSAYKKSFGKIESSKQQVRNSLLWHQKYARRFVIKALQEQYDDVTDYLGQARFALAQFYDREEQRIQQLELSRLAEENAKKKLDKKKSPDNTALEEKQ